MKTLYQTQVTAEGGRAGHVRSADGTLDLALSLPRELGGAGGAATNPEQLFAAGYAACFENAVLHVARLKQVKLASTAVTATVGIGPREDGGFALTVALAATLGRGPGDGRSACGRGAWRVPLLACRPWQY